MSFYELQLDRKMIKTHWRLSKRREYSLYINNIFKTNSQISGFAKSPYYYPNWVPDVGTKSTLSVPQTLLYAWGDGTYYMMDDYGDGMNDYSPASGSGFLTLTLRNGVDLVIDATTGKLCEAVDLNGNKLTFSDHGITHSSGKGVVFERDYQDRITAITGPDGRRVEYIYDNKGDLIAVKDQTGATVSFTYLTDPKAPEHYLDQVYYSHFKMCFLI
jgi:hypothetical protein